MEKNNEILKLNGVSKSVLNNKAKSLSINKTSKEKFSKKYKSLTNASFSNKSILQKYFNNKIKSKINDNDTIDITIVPMKSKLYQGTDFKFNQNDDIETKTKKYFNYYDKRHNKSYFVGSDKIASMYGKNLDFSNIIYVTVPDSELVRNPKYIYKYIYPLYYNDDIRGSNIIYKLKDNLNLLNISDINVVRKLWNILHNMKDTKKSNEYKDTLKFVCAHDDCDEDVPPLKTRRYSMDKYDDQLVEIFKEILVPYIKENYGVNIDGWIYFMNKDEHFHDEILLINNKKLYIYDIKTYIPSFYKDLPTRKQFLDTIKHKMIMNNDSIQDNTILSNYVRIKHK